jgi:RecB family exonuclease
MIKKQDILNRIELRQSTIQDYLKCPLMFKYKHLDGMKPATRNAAAVNGTVLHQILKELHTENWDLPIAARYDILFQQEEQRTDEPPIYWKDDREKELTKYLVSAAEILGNYRKDPLNQSALIILAEAPFRVKVAGYCFTGTIDQLRQNYDGTLELIDYKSNAQAPNTAFLANDWQLNLYTYALWKGEVQQPDGTWKQMNILPYFSSWYFLRNHEVRKRSTVNGKAGEQKGDALLRTHKTQYSLKLFEKETADLMKVMLKNWHFPNPNHCQLCGYSFECLSRLKENTLSAEMIEQAHANLTAVDAA